jgi:[ribosomal protein S5]-alanine N-acetyltransferase
VPWPYPDDGVSDYIRHRLLLQQGHDRWTWAIALRTNPAELIGLVDLWRSGTPENRGFWLARPFWGQGIMTEAVTPVVDYAFDQLGFDRLIFSNARGNIASRRVKEKTGARLIGIEPATFVDPQYTERELWELTKEMWQALT